jgi:hypothetical protein
MLAIIGSARLPVNATKFNLSLIKPQLNVR